ncbi:protein croquemort-like isoform X2 [Macrosteles quadrilineatus]|nr:protein croquemort-like isoform X2 [Macrosteles quadrilineatus]XP_054262105.1 protein croquemort-like isoform X2 [Macrosteles quadrilineatus]
MQPRKVQCMSRLKIHALFLLGLCFIVLAAVLPMFWPTYYKIFIADTLKMSRGSKTHQIWDDNPVPIYMDFYFFNWTNVNDLEDEGEMHIPQMQELGPYRFTEKIKRVNVTWNSNNTVTYQQAKYWYFDPENSRGSLDDEITTLNIVALTAAFTVRDWMFILRTATNTAIVGTKQKIHVVKKVRELLFEGYSDQLISMAKKMPSFASVKVPFDKFAWFYKRNGTSFMDGVFNMNTGEEDIYKIGKLENWNYDNSTSFYEGDCANVVGTTGQLFPPGQTRESKVTMFSPDLCRSVSFEYEEDTEVEGVPGYRYVGGMSMLDNGTVFEDNSCYCNGECTPSGVLNETSCRFGAPAFASFPHFYLADPFFTDNVRGLRPVKEKHQFYLVLEPTTGIPLDVAARFQINLLLQPLPGMGLYSNVPTVFFPMLWFQQRATILPSMALGLRLLLFLQHLGIILCILSALCGCLMLGYSLVLCLGNHKARTMEMQKNKDDYNMYVAAMESPKKESKSGKKQYIVMKPRSELNSNDL